MEYDGKFISIIGARQNNLDNISIDIPKNKLVVITGLSGSGKSSLAFDTIYAEGRRRYVESLSTYARQFLQLQSKPDIDSMDGVSPAIAIDQKTTNKNPRSTVSTITEIYDYLRLLFAKIGVPYSPVTGKPVIKTPVSKIISEVRDLPSGTKCYILAPIIRAMKGEHKKELSSIRKRGYTRVKIDDEIFDIDDAKVDNKNKKHDISIVVDRLVINDSLGNRLADSIETALSLADGVVMIEILQSKDKKTDEESVITEEESEDKKNKIITFSENLTCMDSGFVLNDIDNSLFSFNSPNGACKACDGLGTEYYLDIERMIPDDQLSLREGAIAIWNLAKVKFYQQTLESLASHYGFDMDTPYGKLPDTIKKIIMYGSGNEEVEISYSDSYRNFKVKNVFEGVLTNIERRIKDSTGERWLIEEVEKYQDIKKCRECSGHRLRKEALCIKLNNKNIGEVTSLTVDEAIDWFGNLSNHLTVNENIIVEKILQEILKRIEFLKNVGLNYLNLNRQSSTLSGGEMQRIRLASQIGSSLTGVMYVLDEPSIGLHQSDNQRLIFTLQKLRDLGNTVIVVEHDEETIAQADYVVDIGPGAGVYGGKVVAKGTPDEIRKNKDSITGRYLSGVDYIPIPKQIRYAAPGRSVRIVNAREHNLKNVNVEIPLGLFTCVTGLSGSGKSTLIISTLYRSLAKKFNRLKAVIALHDRIEGTEYLDSVIEINQSPIGRTPRSNPATYTLVFTHIRDLFVGLPEAKARGYKASRFSFNVKGGRCEHCQGDGNIKIEMHFLPDVYVVCEVCKGQRYNRETLEILYKGKNISDVLELTITDACRFFANIPAIFSKFKALNDVGLGYMKIGQSAVTLSGGEAQRVKLAKELCKRSTGRTFYILDEPTTGLHSADIKKLLHVLHKLVDQGNTVLVIEHNIDVIKTADWVIDMGPRGGNEGGEVMCCGTVEDLLKNPDSITGTYVKKAFEVGVKEEL